MIFRRICSSWCAITLSKHCGHCPFPKRRFYHINLFQICEKYLLSHIHVDDKRNIPSHILARYVLTIGDAACYKPGVNPDVIKCVAKLIDPSFVKPNG